MSRQRVVAGAVLLASLVVLALFVTSAARLVAYPWDWSPDEGLYLDWGRRAALDPGSLYARSFVPYPAVYGPGLPALLAPLAPLGPGMLAGARVMALGWTLAWAFAVFVMVRRAAGAPSGLAAAALSLAAQDVVFWSMLVRPDGPTLALWMLAAIPLLPARLARGSDRLGGWRIACGSALLVAAVLTKPVAAIQGAPLVLGWLLVDRRGALRLALAVGALGLLALALLQAATDGSFLWLQRVWSFHGSEPGLRELILWHSLDRMWPYLALAGLALAIAIRRRRFGLVLSESAWLLVGGALLVIPLLSKYGASWNYLVPLVPALVVLAGRTLGRAPDAAAPRHGGRGVQAAALLAAAAVALVATRPFPLPTPLDRLAADTLYAFVAEHTRRSGGPILATRPELAYLVAGQAVEMEGSGFETLVRARAPGTERVLERLRGGVYTLLVQLHELPAERGFAEAAARGYVHAGGCNLSYYFGTAPVHLFTRRDLPLHMTPPSGSRCGGPAMLEAPASPRGRPST